MTLRIVSLFFGIILLQLFELIFFNWNGFFSRNKSINVSLDCVETNVLDSIVFRRR